MATRLYLTATAAAVDPAEASFDVAGTQIWELPATRPTAYLLARTGAWPGAVAHATLTSVAEVSATNAQDVCSARYVSDPLVGAQTITGNLIGQVMIAQSSAQANALPQIMAKVVSGDGTTHRGTLFGGDSRTTNVDEMSQTLRNWRNPAAGISPATLTSVAALNGDRIVIEIGARNNNTVTTSYTHTHRRGTLATPGGANDYIAGGNETTDLNSWVEFSQDLIFEIIVPPIVVFPATVRNVYY